MWGKKCWIGLTFENGAWKWVNGDSLLILIGIAGNQMAMP